MRITKKMWIPNFYTGLFSLGGGLLGALNAAEGSLEGWFTAYLVGAGIGFLVGVIVRTMTDE